MGGTGKDDLDPVTFDSRCNLGSLFYRPGKQCFCCDVCCSDQCLQTELCQDVKTRDFKRIQDQRDYWHDSDADDADSDDDEVKVCQL